ncbi:NGG1p interacting factor NIF3 [Legionella sp.]|uniref:NGG1p interacting factor NIF3 n=1 Tax=Legionella sp. TaxID=459 RepID=UPI003CADC591
MYKISFYVPENYLEQVKKALFEVGAGRIGQYACCAWQVKGEGQFMPLNESNAFIGEKNKLETVMEYKVEMVCKEEIIHAVIAALNRAHPYETPAYHVIRVEEF